MGATFLVVVGAFLFSAPAFSADVSAWKSVADGSIYIGALALVIVLNVAVIFPALLLLQPFRLLRLRQAEKEALTPRQNFRGKVLCSSQPRVSC